MTDLNKLRELAEAATKGEWFSAGWETGELGFEVGATTESRPRVCSDVRGNDAEFIAAASPKTILALLDRLEAAERDADKWLHAKEVLKPIADALLPLFDAPTFRALLKREMQ